MISIIVAAISGIVPGITAAFVTSAKMHGIMRELLVARSRYDLSNILTEAISRDYTTRREVEYVEVIYRFYTDLGGNGAVKLLHDKYVNLAIKE